MFFFIIVLGPEVKRLTSERNHALGLDQGRYWDAKAAAIESAVTRPDQPEMCRLSVDNHLYHSFVQTTTDV